MGKLPQIVGIVGDLELYTFFGAEENGGGENTGGNDDGGNEGGEGDDGGNDDDDSGIEDDDDDDTKERIRRANRQARQRRVALKRVNEELETLKAEKAERERKENTEAENASKDLKTANEKVAKYEQVLRKNLLETAILKDDKREWHDVASTIANLDMDGVEIDLESGTVEGLKEELTRVAKEKPFLVKSTKGTKKENQNGNESGQGNQNGAGTKQGASGVNPGGAGQQTKQQIASRDDMIKRFPALKLR